MSERSSSWGMHCGERIYPRVGHTSNLGFRPEAETFQPASSNMDDSKADLNDPRGVNKAPPGPPSRYLQPYELSPPDASYGFNDAWKFEVPSSPGPGIDNNPTAPTLLDMEKSASGDQDSFGSLSKIGHMMSPLHVRAHSDFQQTFNQPPYGVSLRPRSRSDVPTAQQHGVIIGKTFAANDLFGPGSHSPHDIRQSPSGSSVAIAGRPANRSFNHRAAPSLSEPISESPEMRSVCLDRQFGTNDNDSDFQSVFPSTKHKSAFSDYSSRQLVDMIKCGAAEKTVKIHSSESGTCQTISAQRDIQFPNSTIASGRLQVEPSTFITNGALDGLPLELACCNAKPATTGVIKICDIPYSTRKEEVVAFLGRNARLVAQPPGTQFFAVHIIMERQTAKSMDCFVELTSTQDAAMAANRFDSRKQSGKRPRIGDRSVRVELSSQEDLMRELLPRARCVTWRGQQPIITAANDPFSSGFQGFITSEELVMTVKYAENPNRSRFAAKHPQRTYESMITLLAKYPWWMTKYITLRERDGVFNATHQLVTTLRDHLRKDTLKGTLTPRLLEELTIAGLHCPGFSEPQRAALIDAWAEFTVRVPFVTELAPIWPFETLRRRADAQEVVLMRFAQHIKDTVASMPVLHTQGVGNSNTGQIDFGGYSTASTLASYGDSAEMALDYIAQLELYGLRGLLSGMCRV